MSKWSTFCLRPDLRPNSSANAIVDQFREMHDRIEEWLRANKTKTAKVAKIGSSGGGQTWEQFKWPSFIQVKFRSNRDATLFKLFFSGEIITDEQKLNRVLISLVRRAMPNVIAYDICGVQPMTGPTAAIFALRVRYRKAPRGSKQKRRAKRQILKQMVTEQMLENTRRALL
jgi:hypothetical protein